MSVVTLERVVPSVQFCRGVGQNLQVRWQRVSPAVPRALRSSSLFPAPRPQMAAALCRHSATQRELRRRTLYGPHPAHPTPPWISGTEALSLSASSPALSPESLHEKSPRLSQPKPADKSLSENSPSRETEAH